MLNRDTWSDLKLKSIIKNNFIMFQAESSSQAALEYVYVFLFFPNKNLHKTSKWYEIKKFPHISVLDGRTGESLLSFDGFISPADIISQLSSFLTEQPYNEEKIELTQITELSEEKQLEIAIAKSLKETSEIFDSKEDSISELSLSSSEIDISSPINSETMYANLDCNLKVRLPDGSIFQKNFNSSQTLHSVFNTIKLNLDPSKSYCLSMPFPRKTFEKSDMKMNLKQIGIINFYFFYY